MIKVFVNGRWVPEHKACISVFDHGFLYGDGCFETMRAYGGKIFKLREHLRRLHQSAHFIGLKIPCAEKKLESIIQKTLGKNRLKDALVRVTVSRGAGPAVPDPKVCKSPTLVVMPRPFRGHPPKLYRTGVSLCSSSLRRTNLAVPPQVKSLNFLAQVLGKMEARQRKVFDVLFLNEKGFVSECTASNIFGVKNSTLFTSHLSCGILGGITRKTVIEMAKGCGFQVEEGFLSLEDFYTADEVFLTNTSYEILPVVKLNGRKIGDGNSGKAVARLREDYHKLACGREKQD